MRKLLGILLLAVGLTVVATPSTAHEANDPCGNANEILGCCADYTWWVHQACAIVHCKMDHPSCQRMERCLVEAATTGDCWSVGDCVDSLEANPKSCYWVLCATTLTRRCDRLNYECTWVLLDGYDGYCWR